MTGKTKSPRSRGRQSAQTDSEQASQSLVTSAATGELKEDATPYVVASALWADPGIGPQARHYTEQHERRSAETPLRFIDLFCGIGGFRLAFERAGAQCVFSSDWNKYSRITYAANFGEEPHGDIHSVAVADIPKFDILCAGFPCQPFSIAGVSKKQSLGKKHGFEDKEQDVGQITGKPQRTK